MAGEFRKGHALHSTQVAMRTNIFLLSVLLLLSSCRRLHEKHVENLMWHACGNDRAGVEKMLSSGKVAVDDRNNKGFTALIYAVDKGHHELAERLVEHGADVNAENEIGWTALMSAAVNGDVETAGLLLDNGADVNHGNRHEDDALIRAVANNRIDMISFLIRNGADINHRNRNGESALDKAFISGNRAIIKLLIDAGAESSRFEDHDDAQRYLDGK